TFCPHFLLDALPISAMYGVGAWLNEHRLGCSQTESLSEALLATGLPFRDFSFAEQYMPTLNAALPLTRGVRRMGSAALDLAWVRSEEHTSELQSREK